MHRLADEGKSLVLLERSGRFKARLEGPVSGNILLRQAQHRLAGDPAFALETARALVAGKLRNSRTVLQRGAREAADPDEAAGPLRAPPTPWPRPCARPRSRPIWTSCAASKARPRAATSPRSTWS